VNDFPHWRRNLIAVTGASFIGFAGFTLVMPFLPLYFLELGVTDVGEIALWSGLTLGVTPAMTAVLGPLWGRLADRFGRKLMVERSIVSFVLIMAAMSWATEPWHVFGLRVVQGFFAGYGALALAMAAESAPAGKMASAIGTVQTAQRLGPALGPVIGGAIATFVPLRQAFLVASAFYVVGFVLVLVLYREPPRAARGAGRQAALPMRAVAGLPDMWRLMTVIFAIQFVERSFGPILPLYLGSVAGAREDVALVSGVLFSLTAGAGAVGNVAAARWLARTSARRIIGLSSAAAAASALLFAIAPVLPVLVVASVGLGVAVGASMTAAYTRAGSLIPAEVRASGFAVVTSASLVGVAVSPMVAGAIAKWSIAAVFVVDVMCLAALARWVVRGMAEERTPPAALGAAPAGEDG
jgi:DHA1 family multidrug resistance protein-like MFS transporter